MEGVAQAPHELARLRGNELYRGRRFVEALKEYDWAVELAPRDARARNNRAAALSALGRPDEGAAEAVRAVALDPSYSRARQRLAALAVQCGHLGAIVHAAENAVRVYGDSPSAPPLLDALRTLAQGRSEGNARFGRQNYKAAITAYTWGLDKAREAAARDSEGARSGEELPGAALLFCNRAACFAKLGDHSAAVADAKRALKASDDYHKARMRLAAALFELGEHEDAAKEYGTLREALPADVSAAMGSYKARKELSKRKARASGGAPAAVYYEGPPRLEVVSSAEGYRTTFHSHRDVCLALFTHAHCLPAARLRPVLEKLSVRFPEVLFMVVDRDGDADMERLVEDNLDVDEFPTVRFYDGRRPRGELVHPTPDDLRQTLADVVQRAEEEEEEALREAAEAMP